MTVSEAISKQFAPASQLNWNDVSNEAWREYVYKDGGVYHVDRPVKVAVKSSERGDSHRIVTDSGVDHYVAPGWIAIRWTGHDGKSAYKW